MQNLISVTCSSSSQKVGHKRIMLFTNNDNPHADNPSLQVRFRYLHWNFPLLQFFLHRFEQVQTDDHDNGNDSGWILHKNVEMLQKLFL